MTTIEKKQWLMEILNKKERWVEDGCKRYGYGGERQLIWDFYHESLFLNTDNVWEFDIQIYDSCRGDTWWGGTCEFINSNTDVEILSENYKDIRYY